MIRRSTWLRLGLAWLVLACGAASAASPARTAAIAVVEQFAHAVVTADAALLESIWTTGNDTSTMENGSGTFDRQKILRNLTEETKSATDLTFDLSNLRQIGDGKLALVTFQYALQGGFAGRTMRATGVGTALLRRESGRYRIVQLHMSDKRSVPTPAASATPSPADSLVLVVGATGRSGQPVIQALRSAGFTRLRALVRDPAAAKEKLGEGIELVRGDVRDPQTLAPALTGVRYVVSSLGSNTVNDPANRPELVDFQGVRNLAVAARTAGVQQFVLVSARGVTNPNDPHNQFDNMMKWKLQGENALRASGVAYTIVRPGGLRDTPGGQSAISATQGDLGLVGNISRADVASVCVAALGNPAAQNVTLEIVAGESAARVEWRSIFAGMHRDP